MGRSYENIFENNKKWIEEKLGQDADFFKKLAEGQAPEYLYIGCSDSRATAEELMGMQPGEVFVHRNIANVVNTLDMSSTAVIQYAVQHLKVKHIIVCGHYGCGGVKAAMGNNSIGIIDNWIRHIKDVYRFHHQELDAILDEKERFNKFVEINVKEQVMDLANTSIVQNAWKNGQELSLHGWVYGLNDGYVTDLGVNFNCDKTLDDVYQLKF